MNYRGEIALATLSLDQGYINHRLTYIGLYIDVSVGWMMFRIFRDDDAV